jgi:hypothetical protein
MAGSSAHPTGFLDKADTAHEYNALDFIVRQILGKTATATLVQVKSVTNHGDVSPVGYVDVVPMVHQVDGAGKTYPHGTIYQLPYLRIQGGANAVIIDPEVGDIGIAWFASHDISKVAANKAPSGPGSGRRFDMSDGLYAGGFLNGTPSQYVRFSSAGVEIKTPTLTINGNVQVNGSLTSTGDVVANGISLEHHTHSDPQGGTVGSPT